MVFSFRSSEYHSKLPSRCRLNVEALEDRTVPALTLGTALSVGHALGSSTANAVAADAAGNSYMTGSFSGTTDFDPTHTYTGNTDILTARGDKDIYVAKYASDSSLIWVKRMGGDASMIDGTVTDSGLDIAIDGSANVYVTGQFIGSADFGTTTLYTAGDRDGFVAKLSSSGSILWANRWGSTIDNRGYGVGVDGSGNVYACVQAAGGSGPTNGVDVLKYNSNGTAVWNNWVNTGMFLPFDLAVSSTGSIYVCGGFSGTVDFDPSNKTKYVNSGPSYSGFILNLTTTGKFGWVSPFVGQTVGSTHGYSSVNSLTLDGSGNVIVGGFYGGPVDFNPSSGTTMLSTTGRGFITKLNNSGGLVWAKALESDNTTFVNGLAVDTAGSIYATGQFAGTVDFDPGVGTSSRTTAGGWDIFVMKLNSSGDFGWAESFGGTGGDVGNGIAVDPSGTIHLAGYFQNTVDFDPTDVYFLTNPGAYSNMFLVRLRQS